MSTIRTFISIPVTHRLATTGTDGTVCDVECPTTVSDAIAELATLGNTIRLVDNDRLHVTLKFLGDISPDAAAEIDVILQSVAAQRRAFEWSIYGVGVFPDRRRPTVVWAGLSPGEPVQRLAAALNEQLQPLGFEPEARSFTPHLTLARVKGRAPVELHRWRNDYKAVRFGAGTVSCMQLMQSERIGNLHHYSVLASATFC